jgi:hypothetical protein
VLQPPRPCTEDARQAQRTQAVQVSQTLVAVLTPPGAAEGVTESEPDAPPAAARGSGHAHQMGGPAAPPGPSRATTNPEQPTTRVADPPAMDGPAAAPGPSRATTDPPDVPASTQHTARLDMPDVPDGTRPVDSLDTPASEASGMHGNATSGPASKVGDDPGSSRVSPEQQPIQPGGATHGTRRRSFGGHDHATGDTAHKAGPPRSSEELLAEIERLRKIPEADPEIQNQLAGLRAAIEDFPARAQRENFNFKKEDME